MNMHAPECIYMYSVSIDIHGVKRRFWFPGTGAMGSCEPPSVGAWEPIPGPL